MKLDLAISPCPNDTFIFQSFSRPGFWKDELELVFEDVEELNRRALQERRHAFTKLSYYAMALCREDYVLLGPGGALGRGCGPLLISSAGKENPGNIQEIFERPRRVLIPGRWTTANLLLKYFLKKEGVPLERHEFIPERYDRIMDKLQSGREELGVIIHEERFTYAERGLRALRDLGEFWEESTGLLIPLGCIAARRDLPQDLIREFQEKIRESILYSRAHAEEIAPFIKCRAQETEDRVIQAHIDLYVNEYSFDPGEEGRRAQEAIFREALEISDEKTSSKTAAP